MSDKYILVGREAVAEPDLLKWAQWFEASDRVVRKSTANVLFNGDPVGQVTVSTIFLGLDHSFGGDTPILFETVIFGGPLEGECERCSTYEAAEQMHEKMCEKVKLAATSA